MELPWNHPFTIIFIGTLWGVGIWFAVKAIIILKRENRLLLKPGITRKAANYMMPLFIGSLLLSFFGVGIGIAISIMILLFLVVILDLGLFIFFKIKNQKNL